jgi:apolipoprotein N-acyltransferase
MRRNWPGWAETGAAFGLGAVLATGQAPLGFWWLAFPALVALIALIARAAGPRAAAWLGLFAGAGHFGLALNWIVQPFQVDAAHDGWMAPFAVVLMAFGLALFWAAAAAVAAVFPARQRPLALALTLATVELARGYVLTGFPWALIGHIWISTPLAQVAALIGPSGLTLLTTLAAALAASRRLPGLAASAILLALAAGFGTWRLAAPEPPARDITLRLVQPDAEQEFKWDADKARMFFDRQLEFTSAEPHPDLVIWPETAVPYILNQNPELGPMIAEAGQGATVALGIQRTEGNRGWNSLAVIAPDGSISGLYDKHHLVPFGEYIPFGDLADDLFGLKAFAAQEGNAYSAGPGPALLNLGPRLGTVLPLICYEAVFPQDLRGTARPDWLLQVTNDAWFGTLTGPYQHLAQARLRAIEQGLPLIRVANTGVSAVIDAKGKVLASIPLGKAAWLDASLPAALPATPYARLGEIPVLLLLASLCAALLLTRDKRRA